MISAFERDITGYKMNKKSNPENNRKERKMRKVLIFTLAILIIGAGFAQRSEAGLNYGLKLGLSAANLAGQDIAVGDINPANRMGLSGGAYFNLSTPWQVDFLSAKVALQSEILYSMRGAKYSTDVQDYTLQYDYLEFPFLFKLTSTKDKPVHASIYAGVSAGLKMKSEIAASSANLNLATSAADTLLMSSVGEVTGINDYDAGFILGADFDLVNEKFLFDVRYYMGMTKLQEGANPADVRNSNLMVWLGYKF